MSATIELSSNRESFDRISICQESWNFENGDSIFDIQKNKTESWTFLKQDHISGGIEKQLAEGT